MTPHERQPQVVPENLGTDEGQRRRPDPTRGGLALIRSRNGFRLHQTAVYLES